MGHTKQISFKYIFYEVTNFVSSCYIYDIPQIPRKLKPALSNKLYIHTQ